MLYGYSRPAAPTYALAGTGAAFQTDIRLANGQPSEATVISWLTTGSPVIADYIDLRCSFATAITPGLVSLIKLSCPAGTKIEVTAKRPADGGYTYSLGGLSLTQRTSEAPDGRIEHLLDLAAGLDPIEGIQWRIFNDQDGSTWATASTDLSSGAADVWEAVDLDGKPGWADASTDPTTRERTLSGGIHVVPRVAFRALVVELQKGLVGKVRQNGLAQSMDWQKLRAAAAGDSRALLIIDTEDALAIQRTALFGMPTLKDIKHRDGSRYVYDAQLRVDEVR